MASVRVPWLCPPPSVLVAVAEPPRKLTRRLISTSLRCPAACCFHLRFRSLSPSPSRPSPASLPPSHRHSSSLPCCLSTCPPSTAVPLAPICRRWSRQWRSLASEFDHQRRHLSAQTVLRPENAAVGRRCWGAAIAVKPNGHSGPALPPPFGRKHAVGAVGVHGGVSMTRHPCSLGSCFRLCAGRFLAQACWL